MENKYETDWTENEFLAYLFIYCINADFKEASKEISFVKDRTSSVEFEKMHEAFEIDRDYTSIQKILDTYNRLGYSKKDTEKLFKNLKDLFLADGSYDIEEKNLLMILKHLFS